jgi:hypothetical protein
MKFETTKIGGEDWIREKENIRNACVAKGIDVCPACKKPLDFNVDRTTLPLGKVLINCIYCGYVMSFDKLKLNIEQ